MAYKVCIRLLKFKAMRISKNGTILICCQNCKSIKTGV